MLPPPCVKVRAANKGCFFPTRSRTKIIFFSHLTRVCFIWITPNWTFKAIFFFSNSIILQQGQFFEVHIVKLAWRGWILVPSLLLFSILLLKCVISFYSEFGFFDREGIYIKKNVKLCWTLICKSNKMVKTSTGVNTFL